MIRMKNPERFEPRSTLLRAIAVVLALVLALLAADWSASASSAPVHSKATGSALAKQLVARAQRPVSFTRPGPALHLTKAARTKLRGKMIYYVANGLNFPFTQALLSGFRQAAGLVGVRIVAVDGAGQASQASRLIDQGVARKAAIIVIQSFPANQLTAAIQDAKRARIPVIEEFEADPQRPPPSERAIGVSATSTFCYSCAGRQVADLAVANLGTKVNAVVFNVPEIGVSSLERDGFTREMKLLCPTCKVSSVDAPLATWNTQLGKLTSSVLQRDQSVNFLFPLFDSMIAIMKPSILSANAQNRVKIGSYNATLPAMQELKVGNTVIGDVGGMNAWVGWGTMDQVLRLLTGRTPVPNENVPNRTFTKTNIGSVNLKQNETTWYGAVRFRAKYRRLWGLG